MSFNMTGCAPVTTIVRLIMITSEALDRSSPILVRHAWLEKDASHTFDDGAVCALDGAIYLRAVRVRHVVPNSELAAHAM